MVRAILGMSMVLALAAVCSARALYAQPKNVIFFIGDGLGFEHVKAGGMYLHGMAGSLCFEDFPGQGELTTDPADEAVTDSAAAGTALGTGVKVNNGVISIASPGNGSELETLLEYSKDRGKSTGLVTTSYMTHATPAAFGAHEMSRFSLDEIASDYLSQTRPNVLLGGGGNGMSVSAAEDAGYTVVTNAAQLSSLQTSSETMVSGQFGDGHLPYELNGLGGLPHLSEMTATALEILDNDSDGFFLMVEGARIDHAGHSNHIRRTVREVVEFDNAVQVAVDWAAGRTDTLIVVTSDHETGGLSVLENNGEGNYPDVSWSTKNHTGVNVPIYAWGVNSDQIDGVMDNTEIWDVVTSTPADTEPPAIECPRSMTFETGTGCAYAGYIGVATANDNRSAPEDIVITSDAPAELPIGDTDVTWIATDEAGNSSSCTQAVMVVDAESPSLDCPATTTVECESAAGATVFFETETSDNCDRTLNVSCDPPSGSLFGVGSTEVTCTVTDAAGNTASCSFEILVECDGLMVPGDCNADGEIGVSDAVCVAGYLFLNSPAELPCGDSTIADPANHGLLDWNGDGVVGISDAIALATGTFLGGAPHVLGSVCTPISDCPDVCEYAPPMR